jgi:hypothetical protein
VKSEAVAIRRAPVLWFIVARRSIGRSAPIHGWYQLHFAA